MRACEVERVRVSVCVSVRVGVRVRVDLNVYMCMSVCVGVNVYRTVYWGGLPFRPSTECAYAPAR